MDLFLNEFSGSKDYQICCTLAYDKNLLELRYSIEANDIKNVFQSTDGPKKLVASTDLWKKNCLEAFFFDTKSTAYFELNFNPDGEYALLNFESYRKASSQELKIEIFAIKTSISNNTLSSSLTMTISEKANFLFSPTAIIYPKGSNPLYFALNHGKSPDFHALETVKTHCPKLGFTLPNFGL